MNKAGDNVEFSKKKSQSNSVQQYHLQSNSTMEWDPIFLLCKRPWDEIRAHKHTVIVDTLTIMKDGSIV